MNPTGKRATIGAAVAVVLLATGGLLWWRPWASTWVATPTCDELHASPPAETGSFTLVEAQPRGDNDSSSTCVFAVASADGQFSGTARVLLIGSSDEQYTDREVALGACPGEPEQVVSRAGPRSSKACTQMIGDKVLASAYAASGDRFTAVNLEVTGPPEDILVYARQVRATVLDHALTTPASD